MSFSRIDKILSHEGFGSRKGIRSLLRSKKVVVNDEVIFDSGFLVNPDKDKIYVDGNLLEIKKNYYIMMNKKQGTVSANKDGLHETVFDLLGKEFHTPYLEQNLHLVGRLDLDTEGLLLFTTDGALTHKVTSPKTHFPKKYFVRLEKEESEERMAFIKDAFFKGITIPAEANESEALCKSATLEWKNKTECELCITEGKFHQVKRMFRAVQNEVVFLKRLSIGPLKLDESLKPGEYRNLLDSEIAMLIE